MLKIPAINPLLQAGLLEGRLSAQVPVYIERPRRGAVCDPHLEPLPQRHGAFRALDVDVRPAGAHAR